MISFFFNVEDFGGITAFDVVSKVAEANPFTFPIISDFNEVFLQFTVFLKTDVVH